MIQPIPFNIPTITGEEPALVSRICGNPQYFKSRHYTQLCHDWLSIYYPGAVTLLTNSCTQALELAAILLDINAGDEVIMPSFTYVSTANAFVLRGAVPVFVDIKPGDLNMDENLIEAAITPKTKAIVAMHYGGVACNMEAITAIARRHKIYVIEDNAQGILAEYKGEKLGSFGDISCLSFDFMKNITCGEGGAITINNPDLLKRVEHIYENGTDRNEFKRGEIPFYSWKEVGSNFYPSDLSSAFLFSQLHHAESIIRRRVVDWRHYYKQLQPLSGQGHFELPVIPEGCKHNGHIFFIKLKDSVERMQLMDHLSAKEIDTAWHYIPLHTSDYGKKHSRFNGEDIYTTRESGRILRLPIFHKIAHQEIERVCEAVAGYFNSQRKAVYKGVSTANIPQPAVHD